MTAVADTLVDLLGETRSKIVELVHARPRSVSGLASDLGLSEVAIRRHLRVLERDELVSARTVRSDGPGRPGARYELTERAKRLFPDHSGRFANELLEFLESEHGRESVTAFLRWRADRQRERYARGLAMAGSATTDRAERLADLLSEDGFPSSVEPVDGSSRPTTLRLIQGHCAIREVAQEHPEICALEAGMFEDLLGVEVSRQQTMAAGAGQCVCDIAIQPGPAQDTDRPTAGGSVYARRRSGALDGDEG